MWQYLFPNVELGEMEQVKERETCAFLFSGCQLENSHILYLKYWPLLTLALILSFILNTGLWSDPAPTPLSGRLWPWWGKLVIFCFLDLNALPLLSWRSWWKVCDPRSRAQDLRTVGCAGRRALSCCGTVRPPEWSGFPALWGAGFQQRGCSWPRCLFLAREA